MRRLLILLVVITAVPCGATSPCPPPREQNVIIHYTGSVSGCTSFGGQPCFIGEPIAFEVKTFGYTFCAAQTFIWNLGDGSPPATNRTVIHAYTEYGVREIELTLPVRDRPAIRLRTMVETGPHGDPPPAPPKRSRAVRH